MRAAARCGGSGLRHPLRPGPLRHGPLRDAWDPSAEPGGRPVVMWSGGFDSTCVVLWLLRDRRVPPSAVRCVYLDGVDERRGAAEELAAMGAIAARLGIAPVEVERPPPLPPTIEATSRYLHRVHSVGTKGVHQFAHIVAWAQRNRAAPHVGVCGDDRFADELRDRRLVQQRVFYSALRMPFIATTKKEMLQRYARDSDVLRMTWTTKSACTWTPSILGHYVAEKPAYSPPDPDELRRMTSELKRLARERAAGGAAIAVTASPRTDAPSLPPSGCLPPIPAQAAPSATP